LIDYNQGEAHIERNHEKCQQVTIERRLEDYWTVVLNKEQVFLIKLDVQGYEAAIIEGAKEMLSERPPIYILMEYSPSRYKMYNASGSHLIETLVNYGYKIKVVAENGKRVLAHDVLLVDNHDKLVSSLLDPNNPTEYDLELKHTDAIKNYQRGITPDTHGTRVVTQW
jgi:hypothetical protein